MGIRKILYLLKNEWVWQLTQSYLTGRCEIVRATTGEEVFDRLRRDSFDLLLLDVELGDPSFDSIEVCKVLKQHPDARFSLDELNLPPYKEPVVFVSHSLPSAGKDLLLSVGGDDVIPHPVALDRMISGFGTVNV